LLFIAWPTINFTVAVFFAFIPLFNIEQKNFSRLKFFGLIYIAMFVWNITTTWWIWNSTMLGASLAIFVNSLFMCIPWMGFRYMNNRFGSVIGYAAFIVFWMSFEYLHLQDWGLSWPWLTLGNIFAGKTEWVQWYEYTGTSGGTLWILLTNVFLFTFFFDVKGKMYDLRWWKTAGLSLLFVLPILISFLINQKYNSPTVSDGSNIVVVQPNIDPYEKISTGTFEAQLQKLIRLSESKVDSNTTLLVWPETALYSGNGFDEAHLKDNFFLLPLFAFLQRHPQLNLFTGVESYRLFNEKVSNVAKPIDGTTNFYEVYNGSVLLDSNGALSLYHKSMLVPGVETLPRFLLFLAPVFEKFGGTGAGYARQKDRTPVQTKSKYIIAPSICYESIYGEYMRHYISNGANIIAIITNDGWWGNTQGHKHHQLYAKLRAIETRKWVVRSANTGISCFVDPQGTVFQAQPWAKEAAIKMNVPVTSKQTFFVQYGDLLSKAALAIAALFLLFAIVKRFTGI
jgi:apolipoprotein N-acyltransferase